ncbi:beta-N-acetylhexosaminidase [Streptomyces sp. ACA25]|uniref:beta-N-acetylhexosaminidase n=1 Tax=Streptomyces sp. ACA25 TaxID=3022596 RepID=UPI0023073207|nr:beta-N-acetylhexosaminidase [Streptomyces sp. ACA25]MDB1089494.1 beta-N-acetylhexosaminidase [Streptomyces sp. ACA25]
MTSDHAPTDTALSLVPAPRELRRLEGDLPLDARTVLDAGPGTEGVARLLRAELGAATGLPLLPEGVGGPPGAGTRGTPSGAAVGADAPSAVRLRVVPEVAAALGPEGYRLTVGEHVAELAGGSPAGVLHAARTLRQLLGPEAFRRAPLRARSWLLPRVAVADAPRFRWRGFMLDVARHFLPKEEILRYLDLLSAHKLNVFHFHLTDDQGWRVEIHSRPRLTEVGAWRPRTRYGHRASPLWNEQPHGGYYTQDDIREIVAYAAERHITVVPEIDIPGHSQAAIAAYPELGNTDVVDTTALQVWDDWGVSPNVLAPADHTLRFYEDVFTELLELFPGRYVHIGGDECLKTQWERSPAAQARIAAEGLRDEEELQSWFIRHFARWLAERGRRLIGWDEILEGGLPPGAVVSSWRGYEGGIAAAEAGHDVVMCPEQQVYLDHRQADGDEPFPIGYVRSLRDVYRFEPIPPQLAGTPRARHVLGAQANLWTEVVHDRQRADYQVFPRLAAFAEVTWSPLPEPERRDTDGFLRRMEAGHYARLDALGVAYRPPSGPLPWQRRVLPPGVSGELGRPIEGPPPGL